LSTIDEIKTLLGEVLALGERGRMLTAETGLLGSIPEMDSMAVAVVVARIEDRFDLVLDDDDLTEASFLTVGALARLVDAKLAAA
jgi:acyl carrier protein